VFQDQALGGGKCHGERVLSHRLGIAAAVGEPPSGMKSTPAIMNWISRAPSNSSASPDRSSLEVLNVKTAPDC
jgi:hypothetical protein